MRRMNSAEQRYAEAFACAERGKSLEADGSDLLQAAEQFREAIRILSRLAIVESAAKRQLVQDAIDGLKERVDKIEASGEYALARAMKEHAQARQIEEEAGDDGDDGADAVIEAYLSAGDWYMKAYSALSADDAGAKAAVKEQIEYVIEHVSKLKERKALSAATVMATDSVVAALPPRAPTAPSYEQEQQQYQQYTNPAITAHGSASSTSDAFLQTRMSFSSLDWPEPPPPGYLDDEEEDEEEEDALFSEMEEMSIAPTAYASTTASSSSVRATTETKPKQKPGAAYTLQELDVLRRSSLINEHIFVPWLDDLDTHEQFDTPALFEDPDGEVPLSAKQIRKAAQWMRPSEFAQICGKAPVMIANISPQIVKQDIVTDCSFVASLCIAAAYEQRFKKPLITNIIYPVDPETKLPVYNPSGKYVVKLWANGVPRKVVIDDLLPVSSTTGQLLSSCTTRENELWVSLIEKAYLKLNGGYDFPGGNSGIDLFALTGWIPERIAITDLISNAHKEDRLWEQLKSAFHFGDCIITMSTGDIERDEAKRIGLVPMHVYAVLNVYEIVRSTNDSGGGERKQRLLQLKNPWRKMSWKGPFSNFDTELWDSAVGDDLRMYQKQFYPSNNNINSNDSSNSSSRAASANDGDGDDGLFWIDLDSVKKYFESIYLNWNPALFPHRDVCHEHWPVELGPANDAITLGFNPQYSLTFDVDTTNGGVQSMLSATVWVLLSRHVRVVERDVDHASQQFLTLHVYHGETGRRVFYSQNALWRGAYSNNPHTLVSLDVDLATGKVPSFTLVTSQYEKFAPLDYTISVFSTSRFTFQAVPQIINDSSSSVVVHGEWDELTAGGRPYFSSFMTNPQYHVQITGAASSLRRLYIFLEEGSLMSEDAASVSAPVNLRAALHTNARVCGITSSSSSQPKVLSSGEYRPGFCMIEIPSELLVGLRDFVLIPSTFEPNFLSRFTLRVVSDPPSPPGAGILCHAVPPEGFGMALTQIRGKWDLQTGSAAGCSNYGCYTFNPRYLVRVLCECELFVRLQVVKSVHDSSPPPAINVSIFESTAEGDLMLSTNPKMAFHGASSEDGVYTGGNPSGVTTQKSGLRFPPGWKPGNKNQTWQKLHEVALDLQYLHELDIAHNDLKCDNIMIDMDVRAKLIDFGLSCLLDEAEIQVEVKKMGAVNWRSLEYLAGERPTFASDVYSFAMCTIEVVSGEIPWERPMSVTQIKYQLKRGAIPYFDPQ